MFKKYAPYLLLIPVLFLGIFAGRYMRLSGGVTLLPKGAQLPERMPAVLASSEKTEREEIRIDINRADAAELAELPGIGEKIAARIVEYREKNGDFQSADELLAVKGIGQATLDKIRDHIMTGEILK